MRECIPDYYYKFVSLTRTTSDTLVGMHFMCGQLRQLCTEYAILPMGSSYCRKTTPLVPAILLYGPRQSGKTTLARIIAKSLVCGTLR